ncbi:PKD domain-containing protein [Aurantiacibacter sediminis]|uniref:Autotransporter domain-containing protein n=1 Tax=Aurantiacibacter sediminis TaxID=2793064 RepID=A0ABS0N3M7_9SPHN|nr:PKD domain-containing protein [Aurantiacibacter sediminis]MBH5321836.1 autotransporter domain-containing protein [Aurantiacibacter sediminis]
MLSKNIRRSLILGTVSSIAIANQALAGTATAPTISNYSASGFECSVTTQADYTGTTADFVNNSTGNGVDQFQIVGQDAAGTDVTFNNTFNVDVGTTQSNFARTVGFRTANTPSVQGAPSIVVFDRNQTSRVATLGSVSVDLAQMNAAGGACSSVAQQYGFVPAGTNQRPVADAGPDEPNLVPNQPFVINGSQSSDPDGDPLTYSWRQVSGSSIGIGNTNSSTLTVTPPSRRLSDLSWTFELTVSDGNGGFDSDLVVVELERNLEPVPDAGPDQNVQGGALVQLDATGTTDRENDLLTYTWFQLSGPTVTLTNPNSATPTFTAPPASATATEIRFSLRADDGLGRRRLAEDLVSIFVQPTSNNAPVADAGPDQSTVGNSSVTLDGTGSSDPDTDPLTYSWVQTGGPAATLSDASIAQPTFRTTNVPGISTYTFELTVTDPDGASSTDTVVVTSTGGLIIVFPNLDPVADAGTDITTQIGDTVTLDGSGSTDPDGNITSYSWNQVLGQPVALSDPNAIQPTFTAPTAVGPQTLRFELVVTDNDGAQSSDFVDVIIPVGANQAPVAVAGTSGNITADATIVLDATDSIDPENDPLTYSWTQVSGTAVTIANPNPANGQTTFVAPALTNTAQPLVFEVAVSDGTTTSTDRVTLTVVANTPPTADAGPDQTVRGGETVALNATGSSDPEQPSALTFDWVQTGGPSVSLSDPNGQQPTFTAPSGLASTTPFTFELTVDDGLTTTTDTVVINVQPNSAPTADAGADIGPIDSGQTVTLDGTGSTDPDGDTLTYSWTQTSGAPVTLSDATAAAPTFTAPLVNGTQSFEFQLSVSDGIFTRSDTVRVTVQALGTVTIVTNVIGADETVSFTTNVPGLASSVTTSGGTGTITAADVSSGSYNFAVNDLRAAGYALTGISCNDTDSAVSLQNGTVALELSPSESLVCTVELTDTRTAAEQAIGEFLGGRNALLMSNQPDLQRRLERLSGQAASGGSAQIGQVAVPGSGALPADIRINSANRSISTSLSMVQTALGRREGQSDFDIWFEGSLADVTIGNNRGTFAIAYAGVDYLLSEDLLVGALVQFDRFDNDADTLGVGQAEGDGWMAGPYVTARLAEGFFVDARVAFGSSDNTVSPFGTYVDGFETDRMLASASAIGDLEVGEGLTFWPELSVRYLREDVQGYVDTLGVAIADARIDQGEVAFSPRLDYRLENSNGWTYAPYGQIEGVLTFGADTYSVVENGLRARGSLGMDVVSPGNVRFGIAGFYDGVGQDRFEAAGVTVNLSFGF